MGNVSRTDVLTQHLASWLLVALGLMLAGEMLDAFPKTHGPHLREVRHGRLGGEIQDLDLAAGSDLAGIAFFDGRARVWHLDTDQVAREFTFGELRPAVRKEMDKAEPIRVRFSPDGKTVAISYLSRIYLYEVGTWRQVGNIGVEGEDTFRRPPPPKKITPPQYSQGPSMSAEDWEKSWQHNREMAAENYRRRELGDGRNRVTDFGFTRDGRYVLASYNRGECYSDSYMRLATTPTGNDPVRLWEISSGRLVWERAYGPGKPPWAGISVPTNKTEAGFRVVERVVPSPDGAFFATADLVISMHDLKTGQRLYSLPAGPCDTPTLPFTADGRRFISTAIERLRAACPSLDPALPADKECLKVWQTRCDFLAIYDTATGKELGEFRNRAGSYDGDLSPDGRWLAAGNRVHVGGFQLWDVETRTAVGRYQPKMLAWLTKPVDVVRFHPDGHKLVVAESVNGLIAIYQIES